MPFHPGQVEPASVESAGQYRVTWTPWPDVYIQFTVNTWSGPAPMTVAEQEAFMQAMTDHLANFPLTHEWGTLTVQRERGYYEQITPTEPE